MRLIVTLSMLFAIVSVHTPSSAIAGVGCNGAPLNGSCAPVEGAVRHKCCAADAVYPPNQNQCVPLQRKVNGAWEDYPDCKRCSGGAGTVLMNPGNPPTTQPYPLTAKPTFAQLQAQLCIADTMTGPYSDHGACNYNHNGGAGGSVNCTVGYTCRTCGISGACFNVSPNPYTGECNLQEGHWYAASGCSIYGWCT